MINRAMGSRNPSTRPPPLRRLASTAACGALLTADVFLSVLAIAFSALPAHAQATGLPIAIDATPRVSVGTIAGDTLEELDQVVTSFLMPDGRLVIPMRGTNTIRVFSADGSFLTSLGRTGEGPGEFTRLNAAWSRGDTIEAFDGGLVRVTRFLPDGGVDVVRLDARQSAQTAAPGVFAGGWLIYGVVSAGVGRRDEVVAHQYARDGRHLREIARVPGMARFLALGYGGPTPLSPRPVSAVHEDRTFVAETLVPDIGVFDGTGALVRRVEWDPGGLPDLEQVLAAVIDSAVALAGPARAADVRTRWEQAPVPDPVSAFWSYLVDARGFIWVRPYEPLEHAVALDGMFRPAVGGEWLIFSPDGEHIGSVAVPEDLEPHRITEDAVIGIARDAMDVVSVRVHGLVRQSGEG